MAGVLLPPCVTNNIVDVLSADPMYSTLVGLAGDAGIVGALNGAATAEGLTLLAPTNDAFAAVPEYILEYLGSNITALTEVLTYHVIPSNYYGAAGMFGTLQGQMIDVTAMDGTVSIGDAMVEGTMLASNGVVHKISAVLVPDIPLPEAPTPPMMDTILDVVVASDDHTTLEAAVLAADPAIAALLDDESVTVTLFAPTDAAFDALPDGVLGLLVSAPWQPHLTCVLQGHVHADAAVDAETVLSIAPTSVPSALPGYSLDLAVDGGVTVNGVAVETTDIAAANGTFACFLTFSAPRCNQTYSFFASFNRYPPHDGRCNSPPLRDRQHC